MPRSSPRLTVDVRAFKRDLGKVLRHLNRLEKEIPRAANDAMSEEGDRILTRSKKLVPVRTGRLRNSGKVRRVKSGSSVEHQVVFDAPYAFSVHERTDIKHPRGRAKFLEIASKEAKPGIEKRIAARLSHALKRILK